MIDYTGHMDKVDGGGARAMAHEVKLRSGWLKRDIQRAEKRLEEWSGGAMRQTISFDELMLQIKATPAERRELAWVLAMFRARKTMEALTDYEITR